MAKDPLLTAIPSTYGAVAALNANFDAIEAAFDNTLSLDGSSPNAMGVPLDMNHFNINNVADAVNNSDAVNKGQVATLVNQAVAASTYTTTVTVTNVNSGSSVSTRGALAGIVSPVNNQVIQLTEPGRKGFFTYSTANHATDVTNDPAQAIYIPPSSDTTGASGAWVRDYRAGELCLTWFGTIGDGVTDDTTAIQRAINYVCNVLTAGRLIVPSSVYLVTNLTIPAFTASTAMRLLDIVGVHSPISEFGSLGTSPMPTKGVVFKSIATTGTALLRALASTDPGGFSWIRVGLSNLTFRTYDNPQIRAVDMSHASQHTGEKLTFDTGIYAVTCSKPTTTSAYAYVTPLNGNGAFTYLRDITISGYYAGIDVNEHTDADGLNIGACIIGLLMEPADHAINIGRVLIYRCTWAVACNSGRMNLKIDQLDIEHSITAAQATNPADLTVGNGYQVMQEDFRDLTNSARGFVNWHVVKGGVGADDTFVIDGAAHVQFRQLGEAVPAITTVSQNGAQTIATGTTLTPIPFVVSGTAEVGISVNGSDATQIIFSRAGTYRFTGDFAFANNSTGQRVAVLTVNGTTVCTDPQNAVGGTYATVLKIRRSVGVPSGGVIQVKVAQTSGGNLSLATGPDAGFLNIEKLRDQVL